MNGADLYSEINELLIKRVHLQEEQLLLQSTVQDKEEIEKAWSILQVEKESIYTAIPGLDELPLVLGKLESLFDRHSDAVQLIRIGDTYYEDDYVTVGLTLHLADQAHHLQSILQQLEEFPHLALTDQILWFNTGGMESRMELHLRLVFMAPVHPVDVFE